jgi:adenine-specific DNA-methyltransferase
MAAISREKKHGIHYTPPELASFLADVTAAESRLDKHGIIKVLDPACGDGGLLLAFAAAAAPSVRSRMILTGYENDVDALRRAERQLIAAGVKGIQLEHADFLRIDLVSSAADREQTPLFGLPQAGADLFDVVIANPPYVRTQVLGAGEAQQLARRFGLTGRVDLYHAFIKAMATVLRPSGTLGLLTSNRFLFIQSGRAVRHLLTTDFDLRRIYDLGDTRLFEAAVLPVIVVGKKGQDQAGKTLFKRVYSYRDRDTGISEALFVPSILDALRDEVKGVIATNAGVFKIDSGTLARNVDSTETWRLSTPHNKKWTTKAHSNSECLFGDVADIRVGIKTTADSVFIRSDWESLPKEIRPEPELLHSLVTHNEVTRWRLNSEKLGDRKILYPHASKNGLRYTIDLRSYPRAAAYFEENRMRLESRKYVTGAGRQWFEIWVPHHLDDWARPKAILPDIAEHPRCALDTTGVLVNGDCYWITLMPGVDERWLLLITAIVNSTFGTAFYDAAFHNKLYAGRRRFMTQYVKRFPLPRLESPESRKIIELVRRLSSSDSRKTAESVDHLVWKAFGLQAPALI